MEEKEINLDKVDKAILERLQFDSRTPYQEIARDLVISGGTVHVRINKMKEAGIIQGSKLVVDFSKLGLKVASFIGVNLTSTKAYKNVLESLNKFPEVVDVHYTTGQYSLFVKVLTKTTQDLHLFLIDKLQGIPEIQSTETFISLDNPIQRSGMIPSTEKG